MVELSAAGLHAPASTGNPLNLAVQTAAATANEAPIANDDTYILNADTTLDVASPGVLRNDNDANLDPLTAAIVSGPGNGSLALDSDGSFSYTPTAGFVGPDSFTYRANDGQADSQVATVSITVAPPSSAGWLFDLGAEGDDFPMSTASDGQGNLYVAGEFEQTVDFDPGPGTTELAAASTPESFLAKYSPDGALLWVRQASGVGINGIAVDSAGNVYAAGYFRGTAQIGSTVLVSTGNADGFAAKYSTDGAPIWVKQFATGAAGDAWASDIALDASANVFVTGAFDESAQFGSQMLVSEGGRDIFVAKLSGADGNVLWAQAAGGPGPGGAGSAQAALADDPECQCRRWASSGDLGFGIVVDSDGNPTVTGRFSGQVDFGSYTLSDAGGGESFVTKLDSADGQFLWAVGMGGGDFALGWRLVADANGNLFTTGIFDGTATFGSQVLTSAGDWDIYLAKIDGGGNIVWAKQLGGPNWDDVWDLAADSQGNLYLTGTFLVPADFDPGPRVAPLDPGGSLDAFFVKLDSDGRYVRVWQMGGPDSIVQGYDISVSGAGGGTGSEIYVAGVLWGEGVADFPNGNLIGIQGRHMEAFLFQLVPVTLPDEPPVAADDSYTSSAYATLAVTSPGALGNDTDANADSLWAQLMSDPMNGWVTFNADGSFTYTPDVGFIGTDSFTYMASDGQSESDEATVTITVESFLSIDDITILEGDSGTVDAVFTVTSTYSGNEIVWLEYATVDGSATAWDDYEPTSGSLTFGSGQSVETITVHVTGDTLDEPQETFYLDVGDPFGTSLGQGVATIVDKAFSIDDVQLTEGDSGPTAFVFTVTQTGDTGSPSSVDYQTADGTANAPSDYTAIPPTTLSFTAGQTSRTITVEVLGDTQSEPDETFLVNLANPTGGATIVDGQGTATVTDDDTVPEIVISDVTVVEGDTDWRFVDEFVPADGSFPIPPWDIIRAPNGDFYASAVLAVPNGPRPSSIVRIDGNTGEVDGDFVLEGAAGVDNPREIAIHENWLYVSNKGTNEVLRFDLTTGDPDSAGPFVASGDHGLTTPRGLAFDVAGNLYVASRGTDEILKYDAAGLFVEVFISNSPGGVTQPSQLVFNDAGDLLVGAQNRVLKFDGTDGTFLGEFVAAGSGGLEGVYSLAFGPDGDLYVGQFTAAGMGQILQFDGQSGAFVAVVANHPDEQMKGLAFDEAGSLYTSIAEPPGSILRFAPNSSAAFTVSLSSPSAVPVTVDFSTADATATAESDYTAGGGTVVFEPGVTTRTIIVPTLDDALAEASETFSVSLTNPTGATIADGQGTGTITDDDPPTVLGRHVFYNNSAFDGNDPAANSSDDNAIATDKTALLPGQTATFANYTSYSRGINGIMVDVQGLVDPGAVGDDDFGEFVFRYGNDDTPGDWPLAPDPVDVDVRDLGGGVYRVTITWADNAIANKNWLQVTVKQHAATGLGADDIFYFGNSAGENTGDFRVDYGDAFDNIWPSLFTPDEISVDHRADVNRDGRIDYSDVFDAVWPNLFGPSPLEPITPPTAPAAPLESTDVVFDEDLSWAIELIWFDELYGSSSDSEEEEEEALEATAADTVFTMYEEDE